VMLLYLWLYASMYRVDVVSNHWFVTTVHSSFVLDGPDPPKERWTLRPSPEGEVLNLKNIVCRYMPRMPFEPLPSSYLTRNVLACVRAQDWTYRHCPTDGKSKCLTHLLQAHVPDRLLSKNSLIWRSESCMEQRSWNVFDMKCSELPDGSGLPGM